MRDAIDERRRDRAARKASRDEDGRRGREEPAAPMISESAAAPKTGKCRKHSKCHCFLFSFDSVEFYAVGSGGEEMREGVTVID